MTRNKILIFTLDYGDRAGGVSRYYLNLTTASNHSNVLENIRMSKLKIELVPVNKNFSWHIYPKWLPYFWRFKKIIKQPEVDFVAAGQILPLGLPLYFLAKKYHKKFIIFSHGLDIANLSGRKKILAQYLLSHADLVIANSEFTKNLINSKLKTLNSKLLVLTPCPAPLPKPETDFRLAPPDQPFIFSYGRLVRRKGFLELALALKKLWSEGEKFYWFLTGIGPELSNIKEAVGEFQNKFIYLDELTDQYLSNYLNQCAFFAMTPLDLPLDPEGFGMVYLEAGSLGKAVLGTKTGGVPEAVQADFTGLLAEPENINDIADKALKMLKNPALCVKLGQNGQNMVKTEYLWEKRVEILEKALTKLL